MDDYRQVMDLLDQPLQYSKRAKSEMERAHFTEAMLLELLKNPKRVEEVDEGFLVHARKTARIKLTIKDKTVFIESFSYNPVPFVF